LVPASLLFSGSVVLFRRPNPRFLEHSASRLNRKEIAKFRIPASAKVMDEFNGSCARRLVTGMDSGGKKEL
jgi:hypothetical protein